MICQNDFIDLASASTNNERVPYLACANDNAIHIRKAQLGLSNSTLCPLQYSGINKNNNPGSCNAPYELVNTNVVASVILL